MRTQEERAKSFQTFHQRGKWVYHLNLDVLEPRSCAV
jgi:hypothetical protein